MLLPGPAPIPGGIPIRDVGKPPLSTPHILADVTSDAPTAAIACRGCSHGYLEHDNTGGHCGGRIGGFSAPATALPCPCPGFRWVDPGGPAVGSYRDPPSARM